MKLDCKELDCKRINEIIREEKEIHLYNLLGQRFVGAGMKSRKITIDGISGNALGAYLCGAEITVNSNAQDALGDTMNDGIIKVFGSSGDAAGYAMRGGEIYIRDNAGYRAGVHMKEYKEKKPTLVIGGCAGSFLGEYQAGGVIIVLGLNSKDKPITGDFACTGMHGGKVFLRGNVNPSDFNSGVIVSKAQLSEILPNIQKFCDMFGYSTEQIINSDFTMITPNTDNPYKQIYVTN